MCSPPLNGWRRSSRVIWQREMAPWPASIASGGAVATAPLARRARWCRLFAGLLLAHAILLSMLALLLLTRRLVAVAGAAGNSAARVAITRSVATAASSTPALAISSATAQNATLPQRAESP